MDLGVNLRSSRQLQGAAAALTLLGFVADLRPVVVVAAVGLAAAFVANAPTARRYGRTWAIEVALLVLATILFAVGRAGWAWVFGLFAAGIAATAAIADIWIAPAPAPGVS